MASQGDELEPEGGLETDATVQEPQAVAQKHSILLTNKHSSMVVKNYAGIRKKVTFFDFKGLMAPVFTCFNDDETKSLNLEIIPKYAKWLKAEGVTGVLVNGITGEGPALGLEERKRNVEAWYHAALQNDFMVMVQIGGAPLPDVLELARQADDLGVHAVLCLPEMFYKPRTIERLVGFCQLVAKECHTRPFLYYHVPLYTDVHLDMVKFCQKAEECIPNFFGIQYASTDLETGMRCLREGRVVFCGCNSLFAPALMIGFDSALMPVMNIRPDLVWDIYIAMNNNDMLTARDKQQQLNKMLFEQVRSDEESFLSSYSFVHSLKKWFNSPAERERREKADFRVGSARKFFK